MSEKERHPLIAEEDWWTVWFGLAIILFATVAAVLFLQGSAGKVSVPSVGDWHSNPLDVFYKTNKLTIAVDGSPTLGQLTEMINAKTKTAKAEIVDALGGGVQLRVAFIEKDTKSSISVSANLMGGEKPTFQKIDPDSGGLGANAYISQSYASQGVIVGSGLLTIKTYRTSKIFFGVIVSLLAIALLTAVGVKVMGEKAGKYLLAFIVIAAFAIIAYAISHQTQIKAYGLSYAFWALLFGLLISNTVGTPEFLKAGLRTEMYIKTGLVLLGAEILFGKILKLGLPGLMVAWIVTPVVVIFMYIFGVRVLKMVSKPLVIIIAAATSVCGVSAAIAAAAASRAKKEELTLAVGMTLIFTVLMMIFMPLLIKYWGMNDVLGAAWMGGTIDSTGAVVAAGSMLGPRAETVAAVVKMIQNILIGVLGFGIAVYWCTSVDRDPCAARPSLLEIWIRFPKFIVGFVAASLLFSFILAPLFGWLFSGEGMALVEKNVLQAITTPLRGWFFCIAFISIGLESNFKDLASQLVGGKPIILYVVGQTFNLVLTLFIAWIAFMLIFPNSI